MILRFLDFELYNSSVFLLNLKIPKPSNPEILKHLLQQKYQYSCYITHQREPGNPF